MATTRSIAANLKSFTAFRFRYTSQTCYSLFNFYFHGTSSLTTVCTLCLHLTVCVAQHAYIVTSIYCKTKRNDLHLCRTNKLLIYVIVWEIQYHRKKCQQYNFLYIAILIYVLSITYYSFI